MDKPPRNRDNRTLAAPDFEELSRNHGAASSKEPGKATAAVFQARDGGAAKSEFRRRGRAKP